MPKKTEKKETTEEKVEEKVAVKESSKKATRETKNNKEKEFTPKTLSEFDWHNYEEGIDEVDEKQIKEFETKL